MLSEFLIKQLVSEILFNSRICEDMNQQNTVNFLYKELLLEKLLVGEPVSVPELRKILRKKILNFEFIKLDGEVRPARGTTMMKYVPQADHPKGVRPSSPKVATFFDLDKKAWRSVSNRSKEIVLKYGFGEKEKPVFVVKDKEAPPEKEITKEIPSEEEPIKDIKPVEKPTVDVKSIEPEEKPTVDIKDVEPEERPTIDVKDVEPEERPEAEIADVHPVKKPEVTSVLKPSPTYGFRLKEPKPKQPEVKAIAKEPVDALPLPIRYGGFKPQEPTSPLSKPATNYGGFRPDTPINLGGFKRDEPETQVLIPKEVNEPKQNQQVLPAKETPLTIEPDDQI